MLRLPQFGVETPLTIADAVKALNVSGARLVAGGTDLLPNLKHKLENPTRLVSLSAVAELQRIEIEADEVKIGAGVTLSELSEDERLQKLFPSLCDAAGRVASPVIRNSATLGGNVNLDTRCRYVNQTDFWRLAIGGGCIKSEGDVCHVVPKGRKCVAAMSSDCVPVLISLDAEIILVGPEGERRMPLESYYVANGERHTVRTDQELATAIVIPKAKSVQRCSYTKWSVRKSIDFPLLSIAVRFDLQSDDSAAAITRAEVVVGVLGAKPRKVSKLDTVVGKALNDPETAKLIAEAAYKQCKPLPNVPYEPEYRREMIRVYTRRAVESLI